MRGPPVPPGEPTGLNQERPGQMSEAGSSAGRRSRETLLPGNHNPGDGQVVSMVNTCESAIKTVMANEPKWLSFGKSGSGQNGNVGRRAVLNGAAPWMMSPPVDSRHLPSRVLRERNVETPYDSRRRWCRRVGSPRGGSIVVRAWDIGRSEGRAVMARIPVDASPDAKAG